MVPDKNITKQKNTYCQHENAIFLNLQTILYYKRKSGGKGQGLFLFFESACSVGRLQMEQTEKFQSILFFTPKKLTKNLRAPPLLQQPQCSKREN